LDYHLKHQVINLILRKFGLFATRAFFVMLIFAFALPISFLFQGLLAALGLKEALLDEGVTRMDPISPPDEASPFADLLAWQVYHFIHKLGNVDSEAFVFG